MKTKKKPTIKSLKRKADHLARDVAFLKYGKFCHVQRFYPHIKVTHSAVFQADHCISRKNKYFIYDVRNLLPVCRKCNSAKSWKNKSVDRAINEIVEKRDPQWYADAVWLDQTHEANVNFSKRWYLEEKILDLENELKRLDKTPNKK